MTVQLRVYCYVQFQSPYGEIVNSDLVVTSLWLFFSIRFSSLLWKKDVPWQITRRPFIRSQTMILFAFKGRFTFLYESSYVFSMRINIFGDKVRVFRRQVSYHSKSILTNRIKQPNNSRYKTSLKAALYRHFSCKIQFSVTYGTNSYFQKESN